MVFTLLRRCYQVLNPPVVPKTDNPLRIGILGAATIAPLSIINPASTHADVVIEAIAARDPKRAEAFAKRHGVKRVHKTYDDLINDPDIEAIYNPLPNGLHAEWTIKAIEAGKHVLLEKPSASNGKEAQEIWTRAKAKNVVVLEAYHHRFHPALHQFAYQMYGVMTAQNPLMEVECKFVIPFSIWKDTDIRLNYALAGGLMMDMGVYPLSTAIYACRAVAGTEKRADWQSQIEVVSVEKSMFTPSSSTLKTHCDSEGKPAVDKAMKIELLVPSARPQKIKCTIWAGCEGRAPAPLIPSVQVPALDMGVKGIFKDGSTVEFSNYGFAQFYHSITTTLRGRSAELAGVKEGTKQYAKAYVPDAEHAVEERMERACKDGYWPGGKGQPYWTTYRYMLEGFVEGVRKAQNGMPAHEARGSVWVDPLESITLMRVVDMIYEKAGLPIRGI